MCFRFRIDEYEAALKEWEENRPPGSASSADPFAEKAKRRVGGNFDFQQLKCIFSIMLKVCRLFESLNYRGDPLSTPLGGRGLKTFEGKYILIQENRY